MDYLNFLSQLLGSLVAGIPASEQGTLVLTSAGYLALAAGALLIITKSLKKIALLAVVLGALSVMVTGGTLSLTSILDNGWAAVSFNWL